MKVSKCHTVSEGNIGHSVSHKDFELNAALEMSQRNTLLRPSLGQHVSCPELKRSVELRRFGHFRTLSCSRQRWVWDRPSGDLPRHMLTRHSRFPCIISFPSIAYFFFPGSHSPCLTCLSPFLQSFLYFSKMPYFSFQASVSSFHADMYNTSKFLIYLLFLMSRSRLLFLFLVSSVPSSFLRASLCTWGKAKLLVGFGSCRLFLYSSVITALRQKRFYIWSCCLRRLFWLLCVLAAFQHFMHECLTAHIVFMSWKIFFVCRASKRSASLLLYHITSE